MGKMSREHHKISQKNFFDLQIWKIMGAAMEAHNVLHNKPIIGKNKKDLAAQVTNLATKSFSYIFWDNCLFEQKFLSQIICMFRRYTPIIDFCDINTAVQFSPQAIQ